MTPIVVMGPAGCGKSTLASLLARALGQPFVEGDNLHPESNRRRMALGQALTDADRFPFLLAVAAALEGRPPPVVSCSALKRAYRDLLRSHAPDTIFVLPVVPEQELARRVAERAAHFMPATLVASQLAVLEPLQPDEQGITLDGLLPSDAQLACSLKSLGTCLDTPDR